MVCIVAAEDGVLFGVPNELLLLFVDSIFEKEFFDRYVVSSIITSLIYVLWLLIVDCCLLCVVRATNKRRFPQLLHFAVGFVSRNYEIKQYAPKDYSRSLMTVSLSLSGDHTPRRNVVPIEHLVLFHLTKSA